jgi:hypothetical protein
MRHLLDLAPALGQKCSSVMQMSPWKISATRLQHTLQSEGLSPVTCHRWNLHGRLGIGTSPDDLMCSGETASQSEARAGM